MKVRTFIDRPILSCVISVFILILGFLSLVNLPMEQFPDIAPPTVTVSATYTGANAETVQKAVIAPLEEAINGVENMTYMTSTATNTGQATITVYFRQGTDPDMATVNIKNRVAEAEGLLPAEVTADWRQCGERADRHSEIHRPLQPRRRSIRTSSTII